MAKLIETVYGDIRYQSRLAARWALLFDLLGIEHQYRPITYKLTDLGDRLWTADFLLPGLECDPETEKPRETFIELFDHSPNAIEVELASHFGACGIRERAVYAFYNDVAGEGYWCWDNPIRCSSRTISEFAQCPFCGHFFIGCFKENGQNQFCNHHFCLAECSFAEAYDIDSSFMDFSGNHQRLPMLMPTSSPMLDIARSTTRTFRFESREAIDKLHGVKSAINELRGRHNFANTALIRAITDHACRLSLDPACPRYWEPWYVAHVTHKKSGSIRPCPCSHCQGKKSAKVSTSDLDSMPAPDLKM